MTTLSPTRPLPVFKPGEAHQVADFVQEFLEEGIDFIADSGNHSLPVLVRREKAALVYNETDATSLAWTTHLTTIQAIAGWAAIEFSRGAREIRLKPVPGS